VGKQKTSSLPSLEEKELFKLDFGNTSVADSKSWVDEVSRKINLSLLLRRRKGGLHLDG